MALLTSITDFNINNMRSNLALLSHKSTFSKFMEFILSRGFTVYNNPDMQ